MAMTITYEFEGALYVNLTNACSNDCEFCLRNNHDGVNGKDILWLDREPTLEEIIQDFNRRDLTKYNWIVFCGYGEPMMRYKTLMDAAKWLKSNHSHLRIRINTNGQVNMIEKRDVTPEFENIIDAISISLNAATPEGYDKVCHSCFGLEAYSGLLDFAKKAKRFVPNVTLSIVDHNITTEEIEQCRNIADECGVSFRVREYIE